MSKLSKLMQQKQRIGARIGKELARLRAKAEREGRIKHHAGKKKSAAGKSGRSKRATGKGYASKAKAKEVAKRLSKTLGGAWHIIRVGKKYKVTRFRL